MTNKNHVFVSDLLGIVKITQDAVVQASHVVEALQWQVIHPPFVPNTPIQSLVTGLSAGVYSSLRFTAKWVGKGAHHALQKYDPKKSLGFGFQKKSDLVAAINGVMGDYLSDSENPLAQPMLIKYKGIPLTANNRDAILNDEPVTGKILLLLHGLCMDDRCWWRNEHNHGEALAEELQLTPLYVQYNTGLHVAENGEKLNAQIEELLNAWPVPVKEIIIVAHSMGGLVGRSAVHLAQQQQCSWVGKLKTIVFLGTPHHGTSLEKVGNYVHALLHALRYTRPLAKIAKLRSAGITDLRFGNLVQEDKDPHCRFARHTDERKPIGLPEQINCYALAATLGKSDNNIKSYVAGDGLVPLESALGQHENPEQQLPFSDTHTLYETGHMDLLSSAAGYAIMKEWLAAE